MKTIKALKVLAGLALASSMYSASAATIDILWYTGGVEAFGGTGGTYHGAVSNLEAQEESAFNVASLNNWNITFWDGGAMPSGSFDVLVTASPQGGWSASPEYSSLLGSVSGSSFGDRVLLTGQDADWHYIYGPGASSFDGPAGFLIDAINWAGSGSGMGGVILGAELASDLFGPSAVDVSGGGNTVIIPGPMASFPINEGLTSAGLSNWNTSAHEAFSFDSSWTAINLDGAGGAITIVSTATVDGGTDGAVPEPSTVFGGIALAGLAASRMLRRK
jgi:hypothetical protein